MNQPDKQLVRFTTSGSVDDGKSTLIGRLLYETKSIFEDQLAAVERTSKRRGIHEADLSLLLDGLAAEREQCITIDVAYRYFEIDKRKFIIADTPGHEQYTRNMFTCASTADVAIVLIDARNGVLTQSKRHGFLISLLGIPHLIVAINKMDLIDFRQEVYDSLAAEYSRFSEKLGIHDITYIPVSALKGDNIVSRSTSMPWYQGHTLLQQLESVHVTADQNLIDFRFPVQFVIRPHQNFRGFAGTVASGAIRCGEEIIALPSGKPAIIESIVTFDGKHEQAAAAQSIVLTLDREIDISRGDMLVRRNNLPQAGRELDAVICWMSDTPLHISAPYFIKHTTRVCKAFISRILYTIDVNSLHRQASSTMQLNEIGRVEIKTSQPLFFDPYHKNHNTGSFILIDPLTNATVAGGMIRDSARDIDALIQATSAAQIGQRRSSNVLWQESSISRTNRESSSGHKAAVLWLTGLSSAGKSTIAAMLEHRLFASGYRSMVLDGDNLRHGLCGDLGFSQKDRTENIRRVSEVARLFFENGSIVLCPFISPFRQDRAYARSLIEPGRFFEIHVKCSLEVCKRRDPKKLYQKALAGEVKEFTGISSPYEEPLAPEIVVETDLETPQIIVERIYPYLQTAGIIPC